MYKNINVGFYAIAATQQILINRNQLNISWIVLLAIAAGLDKLYIQFNFISFNFFN